MYDQSLNFFISIIQTPCFQKNYPDPTKQLPVYEKILFNKEVSLIDYSYENCVKVLTTDGSVFKASNVIFTPSLGVLKEQYAKLFKPALPESKIDAIKVGRRVI